MRPISIIRQRLGLTQAALAAGLGMTQGNIYHYERGQTIPPDVAERLIKYAKTLGLELTFDDVYRGLPEEATRKEAA